MMKKNINIQFAIIIGLMIFTERVHSQTFEEKITVNKDGFYPVPVLFYLPNTGYAFGAAFLYYNNPEPDNPSRFPDVIGGFGTYSTKKQIQGSFRVNRFFGNNDYKFDLEVSYYHTPDKFWGIGPDPLTKVSEDVTYNQYRIKIDFLLSTIKNFYLGPYFWFEKFSLADYDPNGVIVKGNLLGSLGVTTSGLGMEMVIDYRDSLFFPTNGIYVDMKGLYFNELLYSDVNFFRFDLDIRYYIGITAGQVLALNTLFNSTAGDVLIQMLPKLGSHQMMRGYPMGKYLDKNLWAIQAEYRRPLFWRIGASVFAGVGQVFPKFSQFSLNDLKIAGGLGLRYLLDKEQHLNVRLDIAQSREGTYVYFTIQEAF
ncbi:MAG: BamA/TamA family outer membrane protein [Bacteroidota bacterium]